MENGDCQVISSIFFTISFATFSISGTTTEFPNCLYACVSDTGILKSSGNPCNLAHSRGVSRLGFLPSCSILFSLPQSKLLKIYKIKYIPFSKRVFTSCDEKRTLPSLKFLLSHFNTALFLFLVSIVFSL